MSADLIAFPGATLPAEPDTSAAKDLNDPRNWIEPSLAPTMVSNLHPRVTVAGGFATIWFAAAEHSLPYNQSHSDLIGVVQAKIIIPAAMLQAYAVALAVAAGGRMVTEKDGGAS